MGWGYLKCPMNHDSFSYQKRQNALMHDVMTLKINVIETLQKRRETHGPQIQ
uniref:Uncharacterized protein n=1 Tax=Rhizophora mucronata TaxID=61149 RepID=A0A2P2QPP8_RHIMU